MANIRAGVAYVDVRLGSIEQLKSEMMEKIQGIGSDAGKKAGENLNKTLPAAAKPDQIGKNLNKELAGAFFKDAGNDFNAGFRALATGQLKTAQNLFRSAGQNLGAVLSQGFSAGTDGLKSGISSMISNLGRLGPAASNAASTGWARFQEFGKVLDGASQKMGFLSFQIQNFGIIATAALSAPTVAAVGFASVIGIQTAAKIESATAALKYLLPVGYDVESLLQRLKRTAIESPIFDTTDLILYSQKFTAAGVEISKTERFLRAFSNIALVTGATTDEANRSVTAITQAFGKGKLQAEELNQQLGEAMPSVLKLLRDQLGVTQEELTAMVKEGKITGDDLVEIFTKIGESEKFLKGATVGAQTLNGVWQEFKESLQTQLGEFFLANSKQIKEGIEQLGPALSTLITNAGPLFLKLINGFSSLVDFISKAVDWYEKLSPGTQDLITKLVIFGTVLGPVVLALGAFMGAIAGISAGIAAIATPVGGIVLAIIAIGAAITGAVIWLKKFFKENQGAAQAVSDAWDNFYDDVIGPIVDGFRSLWESIVKAFNQIKNAIGGNTQSWSTWWTGLKNLWNEVWAVLKATFTLIGEVLKGVFKALGNVIEAIASIISGVIKIFKGLTDFLVGVFTGDWQRAWEGIKNIWNGIWDLIVGTLVNLVKAIWNIIKGLVMGIINFFKELYNVLVGNSIVPDMVKAIISWFNKLTAPIRNVMNAIGAILRSFAGIVRTFVNYFINGVKEIVSWFSGLPGKIRGALSGAASWLYNTGKNIVQGLVNGVRSMAGYLKNAILNLIPGPVRAIVAGALGINSPSKVFMGYGKNVVQGFVLGLHGEQRHLSSSLSMFDQQPRFQQINGSPNNPLISNVGNSAALQIENYYANDNVDPWRQAEDWYFMVTSRGGVA